MTKVYMAIKRYVGDNTDYEPRDNILKVFAIRKRAIQFARDCNKAAQRELVLDNIQARYITNNSNRIPQFKDFEKLPRKPYSYFESQPDRYTDGTYVFTFNEWDKNIRMPVVEKIHKEAKDLREQSDNETLRVSSKHRLSYRVVVEEIDFEQN